MINIEIIDFYPVERNEEKQTLTGTLRIRLVDLEIEILGIYVSKDKDFWYFSLPSRKGTHHETGNPVRYPAIVFTDRDKQRQFIDSIREKGKDFILRRLADKENPLILPQNQKIESKQPRTPEAKNKPTDGKKMDPLEKPVVVKTIASKEWKDLPLRPQARNGSKFSRR